MKISFGINLALICLAGCASQPESVSVEHKGKTMIVHHRRLVGTTARDRIDTISAKGVVTSATVEVYDVGRLPDGHGGMREASRYYRMTQTPTYDLRLPSKSGTTGTGPRTVYTPPNYSPPPKDQRINDAVAEANKAKEKLLQAEQDAQARLQEDNNLRGQLQSEMDQNQQLRDQLNAAMSTPHHASAAPSPTSAAGKEAESDVDQLATWAGKQ